MRQDAERRERFDGLFAACAPDIVAYCRSRAASPSDGEDAAAEVFLAAWRRLDDVPDGDAALLWLYGTARRVLANERRSRRRRGALQERLKATSGIPPSTPAEHDDERELVREALLGLGPRDREVLLLAEWEGLLTVTARGRLHRARRRFRTAFEELSTPSVRASRPLRRDLRVREGES
jgi:RNA polymerase sigma-70 factor (ECF subfamily)